MSTFPSSPAAHLEALHAAYVKGVDAAEALKVGDVFRGAAVEGEAAGFARDTGENRAFTVGYLDALHKRGSVYTDDAGTVTEIRA